MYYFIHSFIQVFSVTEGSILSAVKRFTKKTLLQRVKWLNYRHSTVHLIQILAGFFAIVPHYLL